MKLIDGIATLLLFGLLFVAVVSPCSADSSTLSPFEADKQIHAKAPDFTLRDTAGKSVSFSSLKGKVILLNFWATWCPPCKAEMPSMNRLYNEIKAKGFEVVAVSTDNALSPVKEFLAKNRVDFTVLLDEKKAVSRAYKVFSMPTTFLIERNGTIMEKFYGEYDWTDPDVRSRIEKLL